MVIVFIGTYYVTPIFQQKFFPTLFQKLPAQWERTLTECGFNDIKVTLVDESEDEDESIFAEGKFKSDPVKAECLAKSLNEVYKKYNLEDISPFPSNRSFGWVIKNSESGNWTDDDAGPEETYQLTHYERGYYG
jgi:hypothetical protein